MGVTGDISEFKTELHFEGRIVNVCHLPQPVYPCVFSRICVFSVQGEAGAAFRKA